MDALASAKSLSEAEQADVAAAAAAASAEAEAYLAAHPELKALVGAFTSAALAAKPVDVLAFAKSYFEREAAEQQQRDQAPTKK